MWRVCPTAAQNTESVKRPASAVMASVAVAKESPASGPNDPMNCQMSSATIVEITPAGVRRMIAGKATPSLDTWWGYGRYCLMRRPLMSTGVLRNPSLSIFSAGAFMSRATIVVGK